MQIVLPDPRNLEKHPVKPYYTYIILLLTNKNKVHRFQCYLCTLLSFSNIRLRMYINKIKFQVNNITIRSIRHVKQSFIVIVKLLI